jgi:hypothetical protein
MPDGAFKTVEIGCEGSLTSLDEDWQSLQSDLYRQLGDQMRAVFSGNGSGKLQNGSETVIETVPVMPTSPPPREHYCHEHETSFKRFEKDGKAWYSHKGLDGKWHRET